MKKRDIFKIWEKDIKRSIKDVDLSYNGEFSAVIDTLGYVYLYDKDSNEIFKRKVANFLTSVGVSEDGEFVVVSDSHCVYLFTKDGRLKWKKILSGETITCVEIAGKHSFSVVGTVSGMIYAITAIGEISWRYDSRKEMNEYIDPDDESTINKALSFLKLKEKKILNNPINKIEISPFSNSICACSKKGYICVIDAYGRKVWTYLIDMKNLKTAISRSGDEIICSSEDGKILYMHRDMKILFHAKLNFKINSVGVSGDSNIVAIGTKGNEIVFLSKKNKTLGTFDVGSLIESISFSDSGEKILIGCTNGMIYYYDVFEEGKNVTADIGFSLDSEPVKYKSNKKVENSSNFIVELDTFQKERLTNIDIRSEDSGDDTFLEI